MPFPHLHRGRALPPKWLVIACLALPQIAETVLAPGLPSVARAWQLSAADTQWVMSLFFLGFSAGVLLWGLVADRWGRRPALMLGLTLALAGTAWAILAPSYAALLAGRVVQALGMATCSVTTQTLLRDRLSGAPLTQYFVTIGMVLAWSPAVGPMLGQLASDLAGYRGALSIAAVSVSVLISCGLCLVPETRPPAIDTTPMLAVARRTLADRALWRAALLVAGLNALVFSFYAAGPFMVGHLPGLGFGWIGLAVALAGSLGAALNRRLPASVGTEPRVRYGLLAVLAGALGQLVLVLISPRPGIGWAVAALPLFVGFGLAIPNILAPALRDYASCLGRAGALFGVAYYSILGLALAASAALPFDTPAPLSVAWSILAAAMLAIHRGRIAEEAAKRAISPPARHDALRSRT